MQGPWTRTGVWCTTTTGSWKTRNQPNSANWTRGNRSGGRTGSRQNSTAGTCWPSSTRKYPSSDYLYFIILYLILTAGIWASIRDRWRTIGLLIYLTATFRGVHQKTRLIIKVSYFSIFKCFRDVRITKRQKS